MFFGHLPNQVNIQPAFAASRKLDKLHCVLAEVTHMRE